MLLFYVRHGDPIYSPDSLTEQGFLQAEALVERMKVCKPEKIYASSSERAILTAKPTADYFGYDIEILDWCNEGKVGVEFTYPISETQGRWFFQDAETVSLFNTDEIYNLGEEWWRHPKFEKTRAGAGVERIRRETDAFMKSLGYTRKGKGFMAEDVKLDRVALFAHQGFGKAFLSSLLDIPYPLFCTRFDMGHSGITVVELGKEGFTVPKILQLSNDSHIFASDKIRTVYQNRIEF
ncbi:MAG: histidine phosphatase family protein [Clostridia bacterium]|nr:histidine phosphatase family protein [Clostridia bacterium]